LFILHADHEQNCSTSAMRGVGSSHADPYSAMAAAAAALYGPLHGGANEEVLKLLREIRSKDNIPAYLERVKRGEFRLFGFGHRADAGMAGAVAGDAARQGAEDCPPASDLHRPGKAGLCADRKQRLKASRKDVAQKRRATSSRGTVSAGDGPRCGRAPIDLAW